MFPLTCLPRPNTLAAIILFLSRNPLKTRLIVSCLAVVLCAAAVHASTIAYTVTDTGSGTLGAASFTNQFVKITVVGDTSKVSGSSGFYTNGASYSTVSIGAGPDVLFTGAMRFFDNQHFSPTAAAGISDNSASVLDTFNSVFQTYDGTTAIGPITGAVFYNSGHAFSTANGSFILTSAGANSTFTATLASVTPEPSSIVLLGTGLLGTLAMLRRKLNVQGVR